MPRDYCTVSSQDLPLFHIAILWHQFPYEESIVIPHVLDNPLAYGTHIALILPGDTYAIPAWIGRIAPGDTQTGIVRYLVMHLVRGAIPEVMRMLRTLSPTTIHDLACWPLALSARY